MRRKRRLDVAQQRCAGPQTSPRQTCAPVSNYAAWRRDRLDLVEGRAVVLVGLLLPPPARLDFLDARRLDFCAARLVLDATRFAFRAALFGLTDALSLTASTATMSDGGLGNFGKPSSACLVSKAALSFGP